MDLQKFSEEKFDELLRIHRELCLIPAPSNFEDERAKYILGLFLTDFSEEELDYCLQELGALLPVLRRYVRR